MLTILTADGEIINTQDPQSTSYEGILANDGKYIIQLGLSGGVSDVNYSLNVAIEAATPKETARPMHARACQPAQ